MLGLLELRGIAFLLCSPDQEAYLGQDEGQLQLVMLQHDQHVLHFLLVHSVRPRKTFLAEL